MSHRITLAGAQLAIAREYGFASWARLKVEVAARSTDLAELAAAFCEASIRDGNGRAARMLAATPELATHDLAIAVILGDVDRVRDQIGRDPTLATRPDPRSGWTPLHAVCASRWHRFDPARTDGLLAVARLLLDAGADPTARVGHWYPLRCAVSAAANPGLTRLLLERGATPDDHDVYLACFGDDNHECLRLLLDHIPSMAESTALAAPISTGDVDGVRLLLDAGADPNRPSPADLYGERHSGEPPWPTVYAAIRCNCPTELVRLLLDAGADPNAPGPDGRSPHRMAARQARADLARPVRDRGARPGATEVDFFLAACLRADRPTAERQLNRKRISLGELGDDDHAALIDAAEAGNMAAVELMLDLGFPVDARGGEDGGTALHAAAFSGRVDTVRLLLDRGADVEARDTTWHSAPLEWAKVGSGMQSVDNAHQDWVATVRTLIEAGASTDGLILSPDDEKPPSPQVAELLRGYRVRGKPGS